MKIAIDISQVIYGTGVSKYTDNLVKNLLQLDTTNEYTLFGGSLRRKADIKFYLQSLKGKHDDKISSISPLIADLLWNKLHIFSIENIVGAIDVLHSSNWSQPPTKAAKVTTVHDLTPQLFPKEVNRRLVSVHARRLKHVINEVDIIIVPSESTKKDLISEGAKAAKIKVIYEAADPIFSKKSKKDVEYVAKKYGLKGSYLLAFGHSPRKNLKRVTSVFGKLKSEGVVDQLAVVGVKTGSENGVIGLGYVPQKDMPGLYLGAKALVYVSFYEGFGLPILEAFASKTPVVTSNISSMPEIAGNAAVLVDPHSDESIRKGIKKVIKEENKFIERGVRRVKSFSWQKNAQETLEIYNSLA